jgi:hypothetical protein
MYSDAALWLPGTNLVFICDPWDHCDLVNSIAHEVGHFCGGTDYGENKTNNVHDAASCGELYCRGQIK